MEKLNLNNMFFEDEENENNEALRKSTGSSKNKWASTEMIDSHDYKAKDNKLDASLVETAKKTQKSNKISKIDSVVSTEDLASADILSDDYESEFTAGFIKHELTEEEKKLLASEQDYSPINQVVRIPLEQLKLQDLNPNHIDKHVFKTLHTSMLVAGWTLPVVVTENQGDDKDKFPWQVLDGAHRATIMYHYKDIYIRERGKVPCVVVHNTSTVDGLTVTELHNSARGNHSISAMASIIQKLVDCGCTDADIQARFGMSYEEVLRLKQVGGLAQLFQDKEFSQGWVVEGSSDDFAREDYNK